MISHTFQHNTIQLRSGPSYEAPKLSTVYILSIVICEALALLIHPLFCGFSSQCTRCRYLVEIVLQSTRRHGDSVWQRGSAAVPLCLAGPGTTGHCGPVWPGGDTGRHLVHTGTSEFRNIYSDTFRVERRMAQLWLSFMKSLSHEQINDLC